MYYRRKIPAVFVYKLNLLSAGGYGMVLVANAQVTSKKPVTARERWSHL